MNLHFETVRTTSIAEIVRSERCKRMSILQILSRAFQRTFNCKNRRRYSRERASQSLEVIQFNYSFASVLGARWRAHSKNVQLHFPEKQVARHAMHPIYAPHPANDCELSPSSRLVIFRASAPVSDARKGDRDCAGEAIVTTLESCAAKW